MSSEQRAESDTLQSASGSQTIRMEVRLQKRPGMSQTVAFGEKKFKERADRVGRSELVRRVCACVCVIMCVCGGP